MADAQRYICLDVGGSHYTTSLETLTSCPESMLATMFSQENIPLGRDMTGRYVIDRDGPSFRFILNFLRGGNLNLPKGFDNYDQLMEEVDFYQLDDMKELLQLRIKQGKDTNSRVRYCLDPNFLVPTVTVNGNQLFARSDTIHESKIGSKIRAFITACAERRVLQTPMGQQQDYKFDCDPTTFRQLLNFSDWSEKTDYMPRSQAELKRLREIAEEQHFEELKLALDTNFQIMPATVNLPSDH